MIFGIRLFLVHKCAAKRREIRRLSPNYLTTSLLSAPRKSLII